MGNEKIGALEGAATRLIALKTKTPADPKDHDRRFLVLETSDAYRNGVASDS